MDSFSYDPPLGTRKLGWARDSQRSKVYRWERLHVQPRDKHPLTLPECQALVTRATRDYGRPVPMVLDGRGRRSACGSAVYVKLPRWARTRPVVLHEAAHAILQGNLAWHGPEFVRLYLDLLARYCRLSLRELASSARRSGVHVAPVAACPRPPS